MEFMRVVFRRSSSVSLAALALSGCAAMREHPTACKVGSFLTGAALGGAGGGLGTSYIEKSPVTDGETAAGAGVGFAAGGLIGMIVGHYVCQEEEKVVQAPPPPPPPPPAKGVHIKDIPGANFEFNKYNLTAEGKRNVDDAARILKDNPSIKVSVDGYTDSIGSDAYNIRLSERRATTVADRLVEDGISKSRLHVQGFGKTHPIADNKTAEGRARNRRVEIVVE